MKRLSILFLALLLIGTSLVLVACGDKSNDNSYTVTFDTQGGSQVQSQKVMSGDKVLEPEPPTKEGYVFLGWYLDNEEWSFIGYVVTENLTLTAKWSIESSEGLNYTLNRDGTSYILTGIGTCTDTNIIITNEYNGLPVNAISAYAFEDCENIKSVLIPDSILTIGQYAFKNCSAITSIEIPNSVITIDNWAFHSCTGLKSVKLSSNMTSIDCLFKKCTNLTEIDIPANITSMKSAFSECNSLKTITISNAITDISNAFSKCTSLTDVTIGSGVIDMDGAFSGCSNLKNVNILNGVKQIGFSTFEKCSSLVNVSIPDSVTEIDIAAFQNCTSLKSITLPKSITKIGASVFLGCDKLETIYFGGTVSDWNNIISNLVEVNDDPIFYVDIICKDGSSNWQSNSANNDIENCLLYTNVDLPITINTISGNIIISNIEYQYDVADTDTCTIWIGFDLVSDAYVEDFSLNFCLIGENTGTVQEYCIEEISVYGSDGNYISFFSGYYDIPTLPIDSYTIVFE